MSPPKFSLLLIVLVLCSSLARAFGDEPADSSRQALRVLIITGGCCHDYDFQSKALQIASSERDLNIDWTIVNQGGRGTSAQIELYNDPEWASGFDVVVHNECFANTSDRWNSFLCNNRG
jgi:hypothetical protein